jgi:hypothetical protein
MANKPSSWIGRLWAFTVPNLRNHAARLPHQPFARVTRQNDLSFESNPPLAFARRVPSAA